MVHGKTKNLARSLRRGVSARVLAHGPGVESAGALRLRVRPGVRGASPGAPWPLPCRVRMTLRVLIVLLFPHALKANDLIMMHMHMHADSRTDRNHTPSSTTPCGDISCLRGSWHTSTRHGS